MTTKELLRKFLKDAKEDNIIGRDMYERLSYRVYFYTEVVFDGDTRVNGADTSQDQALNSANVMRSINSMRTYMNQQYSEIYNETADDESGNAKLKGYEKAMEMVDNWLEKYYA